MLVTDRATKFQQLWIAASDVPPPDLSQFMRWCLRFDDALMERAVLKTAAKFNRTGIDADRAHRYATKLMFNLNDQKRDAKLPERNTMEDQRITDHEQAGAALEAAYATVPNATRELVEHLFATGAASEQTTIAEAQELLRQHYAPAK